VLGGQRQRPLCRLELLSQPDVLLGQLAVLGPRGRQLVLQPADRVLRFRTIRAARARLGRGQPPDHLDQQPPRQLVIIEPGRSDPKSPPNPVSPSNPGSSQSAGGISRAWLAEPDPVRPLAADLPLDQPGALHPGQQLGERHARARVDDRGGQLCAGHPVGVEDLTGLREIRDDVLARPHRPLPDGFSPDPHVSTPSPPAAITPADDLMIVLLPREEHG
jgi:hypothetical protein